MGGRLGKAIQIHETADAGRTTMETMHRESTRIELLATVAHELRNPLAAIQCAVRVLESSNPADSILQQAHAVIRRQVVRISRISDDLLSAGHMATGKLELRKEHIDLRDVVHAAVETCRPQLDAGNHHLMLRLPPEPLEVDADPIRMTQVLTNLLDNAAKYGGHRDSIFVAIESAPHQATIRIVDHGIGIEAEFLPRVFDLFVQSDQARARFGAGMEIGLSLVRRIVELHHGTVEAASVGTGMGSTFTVRLPRNARPIAALTLTR